MTLPTVDSPVEYALYALAVLDPVRFTEAERFWHGGMLAEDQEKLARVKNLIARSAEHEAAMMGRRAVRRKVEPRVRRVEDGGIGW